MHGIAVSYGIGVDLQDFVERQDEQICYGAPMLIHSVTSLDRADHIG